jgi:hypothetical protein
VRHLWFVPLAFVAGQHGFALLAPYLAFCAVVAGVKGSKSARNDRPVATPRDAGPTAAEPALA